MRMVWSRRQDYNRVRSLCADGDSLPTTYDELFRKANMGFERLAARGNVINIASE